jgi:hypothetical protein
VVHEELLHLVFLLIDLLTLLLHLFLSLLPLLVHPFCPLLRILPCLAALLLLGDPVWLEWMILFELLVVQGLLTELPTLLGLMVLVQTRVSAIDILLGRR